MIDDLVSKVVKMVLEGLKENVSGIRIEKDEVWRIAKERRKAISVADDADVGCICSPMQLVTTKSCQLQVVNALSGNDMNKI